MTSDSTATSPARRGEAPGVFRIVVLHGPAGARSGDARVLEGTLLLAREAPLECGVECGADAFSLPDPEVSRRHAELVLLPGQDGVEVRDLGSHNGTFIHGARVERARLGPGDVLRIGQHLLLLQYLDLAMARRLSRRRLADSPLVGGGPAVQWIDEQVETLAGLPAPLLIVGESGTGKELVAKHVHLRSGRKGPLLPVNCTTLTDTIADSELFGHARGAFSGASTARDGLFAAAADGTLFLDELGDLPSAVQAKLLRTLETGEVRKLGSNRVGRVNTRVVAATHVDLPDAVARGRFRGDLFARLQRCVIEVPPLRARREDVLPLARHFMREAGIRLTIDTDAAEALLVHPWPYNVRELRDVILAAAARARGGRTLQLEHLPNGLHAPFHASLAASLDASLGSAPALAITGREPRDADELIAILAQADWNVSRVAALLGKDRKQIYRWCQSWGISLERGGGKRPV